MSPKLKLPFILGLVLAALAFPSGLTKAQTSAESVQAGTRGTVHAVTLETGSITLDSYFRSFARSMLGLQYLHALGKVERLLPGRGALTPSQGMEPASAGSGLALQAGAGLRVYWPDTLSPLPLEFFGIVQADVPVGPYRPGLTLELGLTGVASFFIHNRSFEDGSAQEEAARARPLYAAVGAAPLRFHGQKGIFRHASVSLFELQLGTLLLPPGRVGRIQLTLAKVGGHF